MQTDLSPRTALPRTEGEIAAAAAVAGMQIPDACMSGLVATFALLDSHLARMREGGGR